MFVHRTAAARGTPSSAPGPGLGTRGAPGVRGRAGGGALAELAVEFHRGEDELAGGHQDGDDDDGKSGDDGHDDDDEDYRRLRIGGVPHCR